MEDFTKFRKNIRLLRNEMQISGNDLSKTLGLKAAKRINDLEEGRVSKPQLDELIALSGFFKVSIDDLLYRNTKVVFDDKPLNQNT